ncbi:MAG: sugar phosphate nucleotidyltransferase [Taibaiella sp.]|jgi:mannose-1-phosphate guanylyltransferase
MAVINVILSGGVGSRLWPLSRKSRPKQYIPLFENSTLFQMCALRNYGIADEIQVIGSVDNYELSRRDLENAGIKEFSEIIEAAPRNTAASIAFAAFSAKPDDILIVTPSDHVINGIEGYTEAMQNAIKIAGENYIVTFGAIPLRPETGYGYIEHDDTYNVISFKEKPALETAQEYVSSGKYLWNSGMFCFKASVYLNELKQYAPEVYLAAYNAFLKLDDSFLPLGETMEIPAVSVDYAVMEHSKIIKVVPFNFDWNDLGSFESLWDYIDKNTVGELPKNLVLGSDKHVEFIGLENLILVETEDAILVMPRNRTQEVKHVYERLEKEKPELLK